MYILVTNWPEYWDKIANQPFYPDSMVHVTSPQEGVTTLFIRIDAAQRIQQGWNGTVRNIRQSPNKTCFDVELLDEISLSELLQYQGYRPGWHEKPEEQPPSQNRHDELLFPPFFRQLDNPNGPSDFEDFVHKLIRLIGIHRAYSIGQDEQAGKADGFFKFANLAVIYDCTLRKNFESHKRQQIENYCNQLLQGIVQIPPNIVERVSHHQRQG